MMTRYFLSLLTVRNQTYIIEHVPKIRAARGSQGALWELMSPVSGVSCAFSVLYMRLHERVRPPASLTEDTGEEGSRDG